MLLKNGLELVNDGKLNIIIDGDGNEVAGIGLEDEDAILVEYDKRGGLIKKDGKKVVTGCFYDFKLKAPKKEVEIVFEEPRVAQVVVENVGDEEKPLRRAKVNRKK